MSLAADQNKLAQHLFANTNEGIWVLDACDLTCFVNAPMCDILGYTAEEMIGRHPIELASPQFRQRMMAELAKDRHLVRAEHELPFLKKDGSTVWMLFSSTPIRNADGVLEGRIGIFTDITRRRRDEQLRLGRNHALQLLAAGRPLEEVLTALIVAFEQQLPNLICSTLILNDDKRSLRIAAAPSLPPAYRNALRSVPVGPTCGSCGTAVFRRERVIVNDIETDPLWAEYKSLALQHGFRSCWSQPVWSSTGEVLGSFAIYSPTPHAPTQEEIAIIETKAHIAGVAIERHQMEAARAKLQESTARTLALLDTILTHAPVGFCFLDREFRFVRVNETLAEMNAMAISEHLGRTVRETHPTLWPKLEPYLRKALQGQPVVDFEVSGELPCTPGQTRHWLENFYPVRVNGTEVIGIGVFIVEITERKRAEAQQRERECAAHRDAVHAMENVLGIVGHELRTPLAGMRAISELLLTDPQRHTTQSEEFLRQLHAETIRMSETVNDLLEAARLNSGRARWRWNTVDLNAICLEAIETVRPLVHSSAIDLSCRLHCEELTIRGDADAIRRLIVNLLSNARKHTCVGCIEVNASLEVRDGHEWASISVRDTGSGIPPQILKQLGEAFALNSGVVGANHIEGTGLGLSICKRIAAAHGGQICVNSTSGVGTCITVSLRTDLAEPVNPDTKIDLIRGALSGASQ